MAILRCYKFRLVHHGRKNDLWTANTLVKLSSMEFSALPIRVIPRGRRIDSHDGTPRRESLQQRERRCSEIMAQDDPHIRRLIVIKLSWLRTFPLVWILAEHNFPFIVTETKLETPPSIINNIITQTNVWL